MIIMLRLKGDLGGSSAYFGASILDAKKGKYLFQQIPYPYLKRYLFWYLWLRRLTLGVRVFTIPLVYLPPVMVRVLGVDV